MERVVGTRSGSGDAPTDYREDIVRSIFGEVGTPVEGRWSWSMPVVFPRSPSLVCTRRSAFATIAKRAFSRRRRRRRRRRFDSGLATALIIPAGLFNNGEARRLC